MSNAKRMSRNAKAKARKARRRADSVQARSYYARNGAAEEATKKSLDKAVKDVYRDLLLEHLSHELAGTIADGAVHTWLGKYMPHGDAGTMSVAFQPDKFTPDVAMDAVRTLTDKDYDRQAYLYGASDSPVSNVQDALQYYASEHCGYDVSERLTYSIDSGMTDGVSIYLADTFKEIADAGLWTANAKDGGKASPEMHTSRMLSFLAPLPRIATYTSFDAYVNFDVDWDYSMDAMRKHARIVKSGGVVHSMRDMPKLKDGRVLSNGAIMTPVEASEMQWLLDKEGEVRFLPYLHEVFMLGEFAFDEFMQATITPNI